MAALVLTLAGACGGDEDEAPVTAAPPAATATPSAAAPSAEVEEARDKLSRAAIAPDDLPAGFNVNSDEYASNEEAAQAPSAAPGSAELFEECGRLLGRTVSYAAADATSTALAGQPVAYFSTVAAFATTKGATFCYEEQLRRAAEGRGGNLALAFGSLFDEPDQVETAVVPFPTVGDQSLAITLTGDTLAQGNRVGVVVLLVTFRQGPTNASIGAVKVVLAPDQGEVEPLARLVAGRIEEEFGR